MQTTVFLALVLFLAGVSSRIGWKPGRMAMLALATGILLFNLIRMGTYPLSLPEIDTSFDSVTNDLASTPAP